MKTKQSKPFELLKKKLVVLKEIVQILGSPYRSTIAMQYRKLTLSDLFGIWLKMELHLRDYATRPSFKTGFAEKLLNSITARREKIFSNPFMTAAIYLDPRYRTQIMSNEEKTTEAINTLVNLWHRINVVRHMGMSSTQQNTSATSVGSDQSEFDENAELDKYMQGGSNTNANDTNIEGLLQDFNPAKLSTKVSIIEYWYSMEESNPELFELAKVVYAIPPTECSIERDFSNLNYVFNDRRCSLTTERLDDIMIINLNPDLFYAVKEDELLKIAEEM